jgi:hypothetical protein
MTGTTVAVTAIAIGIRQDFGRSDTQLSQDHKEGLKC